MGKWASRITEAQMRLARRFADAKLTSVSQAVKAFERHDDEQIEEWKRLLNGEQKPAETKAEPEEKRAYLGQRCHAEGDGFGRIIVLEYRSVLGDLVPFARVEHDSGHVLWHPVGQLELI